MSREGQPAWLPWLLQRLTLAFAGLLFMAVVLAPVVLRLLPPLGERSRVLSLFAGDAALRRTALASALGLSVTACVFFRGPDRPRGPKRNTKAPQMMIGA